MRIWLNSAKIKGIAKFVLAFANDVANLINTGQLIKVTIGRQFVNGQTLSKDQRKLRLSVADNGKGMDATQQAIQGMGLETMRYRAKTIGGDLKIDSISGEGTIVSCEIPISG